MKVGRDHFWRKEQNGIGQEGVGSRMGKGLKIRKAKGHNSFWLIVSRGFLKSSLL